MRYVLQKAALQHHRKQTDNPIRFVDRLPADIASLERGEFRYSDILEAWVSIDIPHKETEDRYKARIDQCK